MISRNEAGSLEVAQSEKLAAAAAAEHIHLVMLLLSTSTHQDFQQFCWRHLEAREGSNSRMGRTVGFYHRLLGWPLGAPYSPKRLAASMRVV